MKVDRLFDAIGDIDDSYVEEFVYGRRRFTRVPWGLIGAAACFCLVIGAAVFLHNAGLMPYLPGPTDGTNPGIYTTSPSAATKPSETVEPGETILPPETTLPPEPRPNPEEVFAERGSWYNLALISIYSHPREISLQDLFGRTYDGEEVVLTDYEKEALKELLDGAGAGKVTRYTAEQIDEVLLTCFGETAAFLELDLLEHFVYLEETDCYYGLYWGMPGIKISAVRAEECEDGTINLYYSYGTERLAKVVSLEDGWHVMSNERYVDNTGKTEDQIAMETLFGDHQSWYNRAVACEYDSPRELSLLRFFYTGFDDEPQIPTDHEWEQLKNNTGFHINYELFRLPVDKMNAVLTQYFGITLEDVEPEGFDGLVYLESTNCYYFMTTGWVGVENFQALSVTRMNDGTVLVRYPYMNAEYVVTLKLNGDDYRVISNLLAEPFQPYPVETAELAELFREVGDWKMTEEREEEVALALLGTFLEKPEAFVQSLAQQPENMESVVLIFNRTVELHPRYAAYIQMIRDMLPKVQADEEKRVIYWMAFYSGLGNYLSQTPGAQDYALLFDMALYSDGAFSESCADWFERYCKGDPKSFIAAMALTAKEHWESYDCDVCHAGRAERYQRQYGTTNQGTFVTGQRWN